MAQARNQMSKTMEKYLEDLHLAEFGNDEEDIESNPRGFIKLLKRALKWKSFKNLEYVIEYLGAEDDERAESIEGCKAIIEETIQYLKEESL